MKKEYSYLQALLLSIGLCKRPISNASVFKKRYLIGDILSLENMLNILKEENIFRLYSRIPCAGQEIMNHIIPCAGELLVGSCVLIRLL